MTAVVAGEVTARVAADADVAPCHHVVVAEPIPFAC